MNTNKYNTYILYSVFENAHFWQPQKPTTAKKNIVSVFENAHFMHTFLHLNQSPKLKPP